MILALLAVLIAMSGAVLWAVAQPPDAPAAGIPHPEISAMTIGGDGRARIHSIFAPALVWQSCAIFVFALMIVLGVAPRHRSARFWVGLALSTLCALGAWFALMASYAQYLETGQTGYVLGFPTASSWMLFGIWGASLSLCALYVFGFRSFVFTHEDETRFQAVLDERAQQLSDDPS